MINHFKDDLFLRVLMAKIPSTHAGGYNHYHITDGITLIQFGKVLEGWHTFDGGLETSADTYGASPLIFLQRASSGRWTDAVVNRMKEVCGAQGYSICLRNSEHVAKYIKGGSWFSSGMRPGGWWRTVFDEHLTDREILLSTRRPQELVPISVSKPLYMDKPSFAKYRTGPRSFTQNDADNAYNVVFVGPTGSGKSHLVNMVFNKAVCASRPSANSVTREIQIVRGVANGLMNGVPNMAVNVFDCMRFCDSMLDPSDVFALIKQTIEVSVVHVHKVVIVFHCGLEKSQEDAIRLVMDWLQYGKFPHHVGLLHTKSDWLDEADRETCLVEAMCRVGTSPAGFSVTDADIAPGNFIRASDPTRANLINFQQAVGLPPGAPYEDIQEDVSLVLDVVFGKTPGAIPVQASSACSIL